MPEGKKVTTTKRLKTKETILTAIKDSYGLLTMAAKRAGVSYKTLWKYAQDDADVKQAVDESKETMLDFAEGKLYEQMREGNMTALIFYLKTQGKRRGYIERQEFTGADGKPMETKITVSSESAKQVTEAIIEGEGT